MGRDLKTLGELIIDNDHARCQNLIMKMNIEGCEWDVFDKAAPDEISQFSQIVIELHGLSQAVFTQKYLSIVNVLQKSIRRTRVFMCLQIV